MLKIHYTFIIVIAFDFLPVNIQLNLERRNHVWNKLFKINIIYIEG